MSKPNAAKASNSLASSAAVAQFLDDAIPLNGASHRDVSEYGVHVPLRNAGIFADGPGINSCPHCCSTQEIPWLSCCLPEDRPKEAPSP